MVTKRFSNVPRSMFTPVGGEGEYVMAQGLGTLIQNGQEIQIITHNHWGDLLKTAEFVCFHDAYGRLLLVINGAMFRIGICTQDAGTLLMKAPAELSVAGERLTFAHLGSSYDVKEGDKVLLVLQELGYTGKVTLMEGVVDSNSIYKQLPVFKVQSLDKQSIISGDSGGGVWFAGKLIGNTWGRETIQQPQGWKYVNWLIPTHSIKEVGYVAKLPQVLDSGSSDWNYYQSLLLTFLWSFQAEASPIRPFRSYSRANSWRNCLVYSR